jgi:hypothetical protein
MARFEAYKPDGKRRARIVQPPQNLCYTHRPEYSDARIGAAVRAGRAGGHHSATRPQLKGLKRQLMQVAG